MKKKIWEIETELNHYYKVNQKFASINNDRKLCEVKIESCIDAVIKER